MAQGDYLRVDPDAELKQLRVKYALLRAAFKVLLLAYGLIVLLMIIMLVDTGR